MLTIIEEMKVSTGNDCSLSRKFDKAVKNLLRETKNFRLESPYETASYVSRMLLEDNVRPLDRFAIIKFSSLSYTTVVSFIKGLACQKLC